MIFLYLFCSCAQCYLLPLPASLSAHIEPEAQTVDVGRPTIFNCTVYGNPIAQVQWLKDGARVVPDDRVTFPTETSLAIADVRRQDRGMYQCVVSNEEDNAQAAAQLSLGGM